jgi:hypothetical protein
MHPLIRERFRFNFTNSVIKSANAGNFSKTERFRREDRNKIRNMTAIKAF